MKPTPSSVKSDINITPLVDVCLVLLIIFMMMPSLLDPKIPVPLPETERPRDLGEERNQLPVTMFASGEVQLGHDRLSGRALDAALHDLHVQSPDKRLVLRAARNLPYRDVRALMARMREAGFERIGVAASRRGARG